MNPTRNNAAGHASLPATWSELTALHPLRPIHDSVELENATEVIARLAGHPLNNDQTDYLDSLSTLVEAYESEHDPVDAGVHGVDALAALLDEHGMSGADLSRLLGVHRSVGSKIINGDRSLTAKHIGVLCEHFAVSADLFVG